MDEAIKYDDMANDIIEAFQRIANDCIKAWNAIKEVILKVWESFKSIILKNDKLYKYIKRYNKCKKINKKKHYMNKILKILKE